jgi:hypothetical protein
MSKPHRKHRYLGQFVDLLERDLSQTHLRLGSGLATNDPFLATSVLQKAIRRSDREPAMAAARSLYDIDRVRLWRRLCIIVFEDFGLSDLELTATVVAAACARKWRDGLVDETDLIALLVDRLLEAPCDGSLDRLYSLAVAVRSSLVFRESFAGRSVGFRELMDRVYALVRRCERRVSGQSFWAMRPRVCDEALLTMAGVGTLPQVDFDICLEGRKASQCILPVLLPLLKAATRPYRPQSQMVLHTLKPSLTIGGIPAYALDARTRAGKFVLAKLAERGPRALQDLELLAGQKSFACFGESIVSGGRRAMCQRDIGSPL